MANEMSHPCVHSVHDPDCIGCWEGLTFRLRRENDRLRSLIEERGDQSLKMWVAKEDKVWLGGNAPESSKARW